MLCDFAYSRQALMSMIMMRLLVRMHLCFRDPERLVLAFSFLGARTFLSFSRGFLCKAESVLRSITKSSVEPLPSL